MSSTSAELSILNSTPKTLEGPGLLHDLVAQRSKHGNNAIEHSRSDGSVQSLSYEQLGLQSDALASNLRSIMSTNGTLASKLKVIPLFIEQSLDLYISQLAVLKAGAAFCPIALDAPAERIRFIIQDIDANLILTTSRSRALLPSLDAVQVLSVDDGMPEVSSVDIPQSVKLSQAAYIMYTSGSTGRPKGVIITHSAVTQALLAHDRHIPEFLRFLQFANPTFDVSVFEVFFPLFRGATLVSCDRRSLLNDLPGVINSLNIDAAELTPSVVSSLLGARSNVPCLRLLLTIGEMLQRTVIEDYGGDIEGAGVLTGAYGPTEATIHCTLQVAFSKEMTPYNIGVPLDTVSVFILKPSEGRCNDMEILPVGEEGELAVGGMQLAQGYLNRPEQTTAAFVNHPQYGRLYRTGDRARVLLNGKLECLGRISSGQVKIRGQRIELGEIEYAAKQTSGCKAVIADVLDGEIIAFCLRYSKSLGEENVRQTCQKWLPAFMVPGAIHLLDKFPSLASGKVDRKALQSLHARFGSDLRPSSSQFSPRAQETIDLLATSLGCPLAGDASLQGAGLDSLSAIRIAAQLRKRGFSGLDANTLLAVRTTKELAGLIDGADKRQDDTVPSVAKTLPGFNEFCNDARTSGLLSESLGQEVEDVFPCTPMQAAMLAVTERDAQAYCNWIQLSLLTRADASEIEDALRKLVHCHELLRAGFIPSRSPIASYAVIIWQGLLASQIKQVDRFEYAFTLADEQSLLRPITLQLRPVADGYELLLHLHHALYDQWSVDVLKTDLDTLLQGRDIQNRPFRPVSVFYASIGASVQPATSARNINGASLQQDVRDFGSHTPLPTLATKSTAFWQSQLRDFVPTKMPLMRGQRLAKGLARTQWQSSSITTSQLQAWSTEQGVSKPSLFQAALAHILGVYTGSTDLTFGVVLSGRHIAVPNVDTIFGPCLTTLPFRVDISTTRTCSDLLSLIHTRNRAMQQNAGISPADIKQACGCEPGTAMFDTLFVWQETSLPTSQQLCITEIDSADYHEFNLVLEVEPAESGVRLRATYEQSLISSDQVAKLLQQISCVARDIMRNSDKLVADLSSTIPTDLLSVYNPEPEYLAQHHDVLDPIFRTMDKYPSAAAVLFATEMTTGTTKADTLTYAQLRRRSNELARYLIANGVRPGGLVCICMEKSLNLYVAILATLVAGAGYLPILPETPIARVKSILSSAKAVDMSLCDENTANMLSKLSLSKIAVTFGLNLQEYQPDKPEVSYLSSNIAYTVFTSGSTGEPKGVAVTRENLAGNIAALTELYHVSQGDRLLQACSQAFDVSAWDIFYSWSTGMTLCSATKEHLYHDLEQSIRTLDITHLSLTPTVASLIDPASVPSVRFLVTSGEGVTDAVHKKWAGRGLHQGYGPSETTNICTVNLDMSSADVLGNIGKTFRNTSAFVVAPDDHLKILPKGAVGEFAFGGEQVFQGYLGMEALNSLKLIEHPEYGRIYKSGDMGRMLADGALLIGGRIDDQVKIRGNRIELGEITATLLEDADVINCATIVIRNSETGDSLVTFWVPATKDGTAHDVHVLESQHEHLAGLYHRLDEALPSYMIPAMLVPISKMPLTSQGKLDKRLLNQCYESLTISLRNSFSQHPNGDYRGEDEDWSESERGIVQCLVETLRITRSELWKSRSFFALGLNSLSAIAFARALQKRFGRHVTVAQVLRHPTPARLAHAIFQPQDKPGRSSAASQRLTQCFPEAFASRVEQNFRAQGLVVDRLLPCTPLQEAMLSAGTTSDQTAYCNSTVLQVSGDVHRLKECWKAMVERHDILRTKFVETDSVEHPFAQVVLDYEDLPWQVVTVESDGQSQSPGAAIGRASDVSLAHPFQIIEYVGSLGSYLDLQLHHAAYDGVSISTLLEEVEKLFHDQSLPPKLHVDPFLEEMLAQRGDESKLFWTDVLDGFLPRPILPAGASSNNVQRVAERVLTVDNATLLSFCMRHDVSPLIVFQAALAKLLSCCQAAEDICFGNVVSGRSVPLEGIHRLVAPCFNTIPVRVDTAGTRTHADLLYHLHQQSLSSLEYQLTPLRSLQALIRTSHARLFDILLLVQPPSTELDPTIWTKVSETGAMDMPVVIEIVPQDKSIRLCLHYTTPQISASFADTFSEAYEASITSILTYPASMSSDFTIFDHYQVANALRVDIPTTDDRVEYTGGDDSDWSSEENSVRQVFATLTNAKTSHIRKDTSMYQLGLDSLNAAQVAVRLRKLGLQVDAMDVIESLTPRAIASVARTKVAGHTSKSQVVDLAAFDTRFRTSVLRTFDMCSDDVEAVRPLTAVQSGMLAQSLHSPGCLYVNRITYAIPADVTTSDIRQAWGLVQRKHPILRTGFQQLEDANEPFAMVVVAHNDIPRWPGSIREYPREQMEEETAIAKDIVADLRTPPWRVIIHSSEGRKAMRLSIHHALFDAESLHLLMHDFQAVINSDDIGSPKSFDPLLEGLLSAARDQSSTSEGFWRSALEKASLQKFPDLHPTVVTSSGLLTTTHESALSYLSLSETCKKASATIQALGQTAWALLLAAYHGEPLVTFGTVFSSQPIAESNSIAFPAITTVPVTCNTSPSAAQILESMVIYNASVQRHRFTPLADIQRSAGSTDRPLFDTVFVYQKKESNARQITWPVIEETAAVDYTLSMELEVTSKETLALRLSFDSSRVPEAQALLILEQYDYILAGLLEHSTAGDKTNGMSLHKGHHECGQRILPSFDDDGDALSEMAKIYSIVPPRVPELPSKVELLHELVEESAVKQPDSPALEFVHQRSGIRPSRCTWSYRQLDQSGNRIAHLLRRFGVKPGSIVAVCMHQSAEASFAFLGILKAGCAFLAMDPGLPSARHKFIIEDSKAALLFVNDAGTSTNLDIKVPIVQMEESTYRGLADTKPNLEKITSIEDIAYVLYTSGTTGQPKGVELTHSNVVAAMLAFQRLFAGHWDPASRWLQFASYWFDVSVLEQFWSWSVGITVVGAPRDIVLDDLTGFIRQLNITHIDLTPALARLVRPEEVPSLHHGVFITGGEALRQEIIDTWGPKLVICNGYGPTEATIGVTMNRFINSDAKPSNIGPPFINVGAFVLTPRADAPVFRGAVGELCVSGKLVGKGYLNRPELTAASFPYLERLQTRVYRTGDLVRLLTDGSFSFIGRQDSQTKLRGQRLELGEIDKILQDSSRQAIDTVSMVIKAGDGAKETLVSFIATNGKLRDRGLDIDRSQQGAALVNCAKRACQSRLPQYMVPTHVIPLSAIPLTVNNKVDSKTLVALYRSLNARELQDFDRNVNEQPPLDSKGSTIGRILCKCLGIAMDGVEQHSNIFSLGLSSISAIVFATRLKRAGFPAATVATIMKNPTLGELARALSNVKEQDSFTDREYIRQVRLSVAAFDQRHRRVASGRLSVVTNEIEIIMPCTALQEGLILDSVRHEARPYFNSFQYSLGHINLQRLREAYDNLTVAVQILRTRFIATNDGFAQVILKNARLPWHIIPPSATGAWDVEARDDCKRKWLESNSNDLLQPIEIHLLQSESGCVMDVFIHHGIYDGISWDLLLTRLAQAYQAGCAPDCGPSFSTAMCHGPLSLRSDANVKAFWQKRLQSFTRAPIAPSESTEQEYATIAMGTRILESERIEMLRKELGVSHQALLQSCFEVALHQRYPHVRSYGSIVSGRSFDLEGADLVMGPMFNTLPNVITPNSTQTWADLIRQSHSSNVAVLPYQHTPLRHLQKWCGRSASQSLFDVLFAFQQETTQTHDLWTALEQDPHAEYPLSFEITSCQDRSMTINVVAQGRYLIQSDADALLQAFVDALHHACEARDDSIHSRFRWSNDREAKVPRFGHQETPASKSLSQASNRVNSSGFQWSPEAELLRKLIAQTAGIDLLDVDEHSSILSLGIDSLETVKLASKAKAAGLPIPVSKILQAQTIPSMLNLIMHNNVQPAVTYSISRLEKLERELNEVLRPTLASVSDPERILPATPNQEALIADMLRSDYREYYNHDVMLLRPDVDLLRLHAAWQDVVDRTPVLRTGFLQVDDTNVDAVFAQIVHKPTQIEMKRLEASRTEDIQQLLDYITEGVKSDRHDASPLRLNLVSIQSLHYLILSLSHAQYDGHSLALLHEDVDRAYRNGLCSRPAYDDIIEQSLSATDTENKDFWSSTLAALTSSRLPTVTVADAETGTHRVQRQTNVSAENARSFCQEHGVSMQALAQTCWSLVLAYLTCNLDVAFGVVLACRDSEEAEDIIFPAMNTIIMRVALHGLRYEMVQYIQNMINDMRPYQRTPLRLIQQACAEANQDTERAGAALFDTLFIYQQRPHTTGTEEDRLYESVGGSSSVDYPVAAEMEAILDHVVLRAAVKGNAFDREGAEQLLEHFETVLEAVVLSSDQSTVEFTEEGVTVCNLPSFELRDERSAFDAVTKPSQLNIDESEAAEDHTPLAATVRDALAQVAKVPSTEISPTATIESIGIDSISAIKVASLLRKQSISVSVSEIIQGRSVRCIAEIVAAKSRESGDGASEGVAAVDVVAKALAERGLDGIPANFDLNSSSIESMLPATAGQIYMLNIWQKTDGQAFYPTFRYELSGTVREYNQIRAAWLALVARHGVLRTVFATTGNQNVPVLQLVLKEAKDSCYRDDEPLREQSSPSSQPMVSLRVHKVDTDKYTLGLCIHHALYDAVSLPLLLQDFQLLLDGDQQQSAAPRPTQMDIAALSVTSKSQQARQGFWTSYLQGARPLATTSPQTEMSGPQERMELFHPGLFDDCAALEKCARREGVTAQALFFAAYARIYADTFPPMLVSADGKDNPTGDVVLGIYLANRSHLPELSTSLTSPTVNVVPLLVRDPQHATLIEVAKQVQADLQTIGTAENSAVGLWEIERWTGVKVHTFVNFLKVFDDGAESDESQVKSNLVEVGERRKAYQRVIKQEDNVHGDAFESPKELEGLKSMEKVYPYSLDVEATIVNGALDVGVFCPQAMLGLKEAREVVLELKRSFQGLIGEKVA